MRVPAKWFIRGGKSVHEVIIHHNSNSKNKRDNYKMLMENSIITFKNSI